MVFLPYLELPFCVESLEGNAVEDLVDGVVCSDDPDVADDPWGEVEVLPGAAVVLGVVHHPVPVVLVHGEVHHVGVGPPGLPVPQEDPQVVDDALGPQLDNNRSGH